MGIEKYTFHLKPVPLHFVRLTAAITATDLSFGIYDAMTRDGWIGKCAQGVAHKTRPAGEVR
ncbi:hypothetical protein GPEL0_01f2021 [Geoanaerobacter pelophilus]|uniref:Uncharacterized protein n=1 Tax=Geoanaerobacter pelophilus TaxID=60036 RepID=A0ABQ0MHL5_9BACT|nr:hypothetical protein GPEL0_01f2021 [Geoanaerobacter pelophilus]